MNTIGEYRVGISFNPSADPLVDKIKQKAAELIDIIQSIPLSDGAISERFRLKILAMDSVEGAAMWAVKAATKKAQ